MKNSAKRIVSLLLAVMLVCAMLTMTAGAADLAQPSEETSAAAAVIVGLVATAGALGMAIAIGKSADGMSRQPEASGSIRSSMMLGLVFIETAIIYALIVAILIIFVL